MAHIKNTDESYGIIARAFHWLIGLTIIFMLAFGLWMQGLPMSPDKFTYYGWHKSIGSIILIAVALRLLWRLVNKTPKLPSDMKWFEKAGAHASHFTLYIMMFYMPLIGWAMSSAAGFPVTVFGWFTLPSITSSNPENVELFKDLHYWGGLFLIAVISVHALAALYHHFWRKDNVLKGMLPW